MIHPYLQEVVDNGLLPDHDIIWISKLPYDHQPTTVDKLLYGEEFNFDIYELLIDKFPSYKPPATEDIKEIELPLPDDAPQIYFLPMDELDGKNWD